jgi:ABC-type bacteriocin/lantibiotic exporter with double-glycine peptidase domain
VIERVLNNRLHEHTMRWQNEDANVTGVLNNGLRIISSLRAAGAEEVYVERLLGRSATEMRAASDRQKTTEFLHSIPAVVDAIVLMTNLLVGGWIVMTSEYSVGYMVAFIMLESLFAGPFDHLVRLSGVRELLRTHLTRIDDIINYPSDNEGVVYADMPDERLTGDVEFKNVTFRYSRVDEPVIKDFSLRIPAGKTVAIVGNTGSGKSTLSKLLLGLHHPAEGEVCVDGVSVREIPEDIKAVSVAGVSQETTLFPGTIRDNITLWNPDISDREVIEASKKACINTEILRRAGGYDYLVNEGGNNLSGGQKQRIQIARALVTHPSVLVMDEATSALDAVVEEKVMSNILSIGCTCIVIAHRLSTVRDCDEIVVLDDGRIAEQGTHEELIEKKGLYFDMVSTKEA